ncbi:hypothetical protein ACIQC7_09030 [Kitasatospora sp. NPDC088556]|uniref:hypothetical protein n=1 Tax=Kitasatospora sp. NPDC088556 TaxID=3364076 RepID=UPI00381C4F0F
MTKLPSNKELLELRALGYKYAEIGRLFDVTKQAVSWRFAQMGMKEISPLDDVNDVLAEAWPGIHANGHHNRSPIQMLRVWMRSNLHDTLSKRQVAAATNFEARVRGCNEVLAYLPDTEVGFSYVRRQPSDGQLVIRWPEDRPAPSTRAVEMLTLTPAEESMTDA